SGLHSRRDRGRAPRRAQDRTPRSRMAPLEAHDARDLLPALSRGGLHARDAPGTRRLRRSRACARSNQRSIIFEELLLLELPVKLVLRGAIRPSTRGVELVRAIDERTQHISDRARLERGKEDADLER